MGLIAMSERDLQRIEILSKVIAGRMTTVSAAHVLDLSERQVVVFWNGCGLTAQRRFVTRRSAGRRIIGSATVFETMR